MSQETHSTGWTRREALGILGMGAAAAALPDLASAAPTFPKGAVIRTILKDYEPEELAGGQIVQALITQVEADPVGVFGEIGSWDDMTADERRVFRAIGRAHVATNLPIFTHTGIPGKAALEQLDILEDAGVKPDRIVIGHLGNLVDPINRKA